MPDQVITKTEFAYRLNLSPARVSQYVAEGMPVRRDGKLYYRTCLKWVHQKYPLGRMNWHDRGAWEVERLLKAREAARRGR
jgi:hypothetical protein